MIEMLVAGLRPEAHERPYWDALREHRLVLQRCTACGRLQHYPRRVCATCLADALNFVDSPGRGTIHSFTIVHRAPLPELRQLAPYTLALVDLDEGVRMMSNIVGNPTQIAVGLPVAVEFADVTDQITLPVFRLVFNPSREQ